MRITKFSILFFSFFLISASSVAQINKEIHFDINELDFSYKDGYTDVNLKNGEKEFQARYPDLPFKVLTLIIPMDKDIDFLEAVSLDSEELEGEYRIPMVSADIKTDGDAIAYFSENSNTAYDSSQSYPQKLVRVLSCGYLGTNHLVTLAIYPLQYYSPDKKLIFFRDLQLNILLKGKSDYPNPSLLANSDVNENVLKKMVFNKEDIVAYSSVMSLPKSASLPTSTEYIVITSQTIKNAFAPLVEWKTRKGVKAEIVTVEDICNSYSGRDNAEKIRNFLIESHQSGLKWVLLGGNGDVVPIRYAYQGNTSTPPSITNQQICDLYYSDLTGNWDKDTDGIWGEPLEDSPDIYPEIFVGRIPCQDSQGASQFVEKLLNYEQNPGEGDYGYLSQALWMCSDQMRDWNEGEGQHELVSQYLPVNFYQNLDSLVEAPSGAAPNPISPVGENCTALMNQGWGITGIFAHGRTDGFVASSNLINQWPKSYVFTWLAEGDGHGHFSSLSNKGKYGIVYSISCSQAAIDYEDDPTLGGGPSVAEAFILSPQKGAVAFLGYSRWGWVSSSYKLAQEFMQEAFNPENEYHIGIAEALSKLYYPYYWDLNYGHNLFGDPEMLIWTESPRTLNVTYPQVIESGTQEIGFQVSLNESPVSQAKICITQGNEILFLGETDQQGELNAQLNLNCDTALAITVTKHNFIPHQGAIKLCSTSGVNDDGNPVPLRFELDQNYPNPFNPTTCISYQIPENGKVSIEIFNILGQKIKTLINENQITGNHIAVWDSKDDNGEQLPSGVYFYRITTKQNIETKKMVLLK